MVGSGLLWGKIRRAQGRRLLARTWHPLACHMIDTAEAASWLWENFLPPGTRERVDRVAIGVPSQGRSLIRLVSALHDLGKATPGVQARSSRHVQRLRATRVIIDTPASQTPHAQLSGILLREALTEAGWEPAAADWIALTAAGHHGIFPGPGWNSEPYTGDGKGWDQARAELVALACAHAGVPDLAAAAVTPPALALQLVLSGAVTLADWLASVESVFPYTGDVPSDYQSRSADCAARIGTAFGWQEPWIPDPSSPLAWAGAMFMRRFGMLPGAVQNAVYKLAAGAEGPGLLLIEAPADEGTRDAALITAEVLASATGATGLFVTLPACTAITELAWADRQRGMRYVPASYRTPRLPGPSGVGTDEPGAQAAAREWLAGPNRALLAPLVCTTIDQLLRAGVSSRHVALRHLGLAGKVVIIDGLSSHDVHDSPLLRRVLGWLAAERVPVIVVSTALASGHRQELREAYAGRATRADRSADGYPRISWLPGNGSASPAVRGSLPRIPRNVRLVVPLLDERDGDDLVPAMASELAYGRKRVLVARNTAVRAQQTYQRLRVWYARGDIALYHDGFTAADRRAREREIARRPYIVVSAEDLDLSADVVISDLAPADVLVHRAGKIEGSGDPRLFVVGRRDAPDGPPVLPPEPGYGNHLLWRTEAALRSRTVLAIPGDVQRFIDEVYGDAPLGPDDWRTEMERAAASDTTRLAELAAQAESIMLPPPDAGSLAMIHRNVADEESPLVRAHTLIGPPSIEVMLLRRTRRGDVATTVSAGPPRRLRLNRYPDAATTAIALGEIVRLPARIAEAAAGVAAPVPGWSESPWLGGIKVLFLPEDGSALALGEHECWYSDELGLEIRSADAWS